MNPSTVHARVLVDEMVRCGVREVVLCPGSRSAPLAYAVLAAERAGRLRLHVRVDERSAGFLALGLAKVSRCPAVVVTTSGTAVANLHPAVLEAYHAAVPLVVVSADRPDELRGTGANQTTRQPWMYAAAVRWEHDFPAAQGQPGEQSAWRSQVCRAWAAATASVGGAPGPVHLNVAFREPLVPDLDDEVVAAQADRSEPSGWPEPVEGRPDGAPWVSAGTGHRTGADEVSATPGQPVGRAEVSASPGQPVDRAEVTDSYGSPDGPGARGHGPAPRTLMVLGDLPDPASTGQALRVAARAGWPVVAEPFGAGERTGVVPHGSLLLGSSEWLREHLPERVLVVGRVTLSRDVARLLRHPKVRVELVTALPAWADPSHAVQVVHPWDSLERALASASASPSPSATGAQDWAEQWRRAGQRAARALAPVIARSWPSGVAVAAAVLESLGPTDTLVVGSSNPARDVDFAAAWSGGSALATIVGNRGLAGIDGTVSTAVGVALAAGPRRRTVALMGDLTFLHDTNGLLVGPEEPRPDLTIVVGNDDGGGIFATLEYGEPGRAQCFERVFGTPTGTDLSALCRAHGIPHHLVSRREELAGLLAESAAGIRVVEVPLDRSRHRAVSEELRQAVPE